MCVLLDSVTGNESGKCVLYALEPIDIFGVVPTYRREDYFTKIVDAGGYEEPEGVFVCVKLIFI